MKLGTRRLRARFGNLFAAAALLAVTVPALADEVQIVERMTLGAYIEESAFVTSGPYAGQLALMTGNSVYGLDANRNLNLLFDIRRLGSVITPKGMAWIAPEGVFAYITGNEPETIHISDTQGNALAPRRLDFKNAAETRQFPHQEGLTYLSANSSWNPDRLLLVMNLFPDKPPFIESSIRVHHRDGRLAQVIELPTALSTRYLTGVTLTSTGQIVLGVDNELWKVSVTGQILQGPIIASPAGTFVEGLEQLPDGRIAYTAAATVYHADQNLSLLPQDAFDAGLGLHLIGTFGLAWNSDTNSYLMTSNVEETGDYFRATGLYSVPHNLNVREHLFPIGPTLPTRRITRIDYIPGEQLVLGRGPGSMQMSLFNLAGQVVETIDLSAIGFPYAMRYFPHLGQFGVVFVDPATGRPRSSIHFFSRTGAHVRELNLSASAAQIFSLAFFDPDHPSGGQLIMIVAQAGTLAQQVLVTDLNGTVLRQLDPLPDLGILAPFQVAAITSGPDRGAFAILDPSQYELTVFRLE